MAKSLRYDTGIGRPRKHILYQLIDYHEVTSHKSSFHIKKLHFSTIYISLKTRSFLLSKILNLRLFYLCNNIIRFLYSNMIPQKLE